MKYKNYIYLEFIYEPHYKLANLLYYRKFSYDVTIFVNIVKICGARFVYEPYMTLSSCKKNCVFLSSKYVHILLYPPHFNQKQCFHSDDNIKYEHVNVRWDSLRERRKRLCLFFNP